MACRRRTMYFATRGLTHGNPELPQLAVDARRTPQRICLRHRADQRADVGRYGRPARAPSALPGPEQAEAATVPGDDRLGLHEDERRPPSSPDAREPDPEQAVGRGQAHARSARAFQHQKLVPQRENLEVQRRARANQRTYRMEYGYDDRHHRSKAIRRRRKPQ